LELFSLLASIHNPCQHPAKQQIILICDSGVVSKFIDSIEASQGADVQDKASHR
jgi:hypothetical protein